MTAQNMFRNLVFGIALAASAGLSYSAYADPPPGKGWRAHEDGDSRHDDRGDNPEIRYEQRHHKAKRHSISEEDGLVIKSYLDERVRPGFCPPGLAKKHNGCLPPGQARKYRIGQPLPETLVVQQLPPDIIVRLRPPAGYYYTQVDGDVLLINEASKKIIDAITLLSAVH